MENFTILTVKVKVKLALGQATKVQKESSTLFLTSALDGVGDQHHVPAAITHYPLPIL
jgi:hypothetical protein